jgi:hypothetical protein
MEGGARMDACPIALKGIMPSLTREDGREEATHLVARLSSALNHPEEREPETRGRRRCDERSSEV